MTIPKEVQEGMREVILNWDKLTDDTQYSIVGLTETMGIEKAIELYTGLNAMQILDDDTQDAFKNLGLESATDHFIEVIREIAEA